MHAVEAMLCGARRNLCAKGDTQSPNRGLLPKELDKKIVLSFLRRASVASFKGYVADAHFLSKALIAYREAKIPPSTAKH